MTLYAQHSVWVDTIIGFFYVVLTDDRKTATQSPTWTWQVLICLGEAELKRWVCALWGEKASFLWSLGEKWNNIVSGGAPGPARGRGGAEFMKTAGDEAVMAVFKCFSANLTGGLCPSELVLTCCASALYWHLICAFLSLFLYRTPLITPLCNDPEKYNAQHIRCRMEMLFVRREKKGRIFF